jgi:hypothetical protein
MPEYFLLQLKMIARKIEEFGLHPILGFALFVVVFFMGSIYLFSKVDFAPSVYVLLAISLVYKFSLPERNDFLKVVFNEKEYYVLRALENIFVAIPFAGFLLFYQAFIFAVLLTLISILMALVSFKWNSSLVIPTPFYKWPFEFIVGFRNFYYIIPIAYFLVAMAVVYNNFNLGLFALILIYLIVISFYYKPEDPYYVWNYSLTSPRFLIMKIQTSILYSSFIVAPVLIALFLVFPAEYQMTVLLLLLGKAFLATSIFAKYASYPNETQLPYTVLLVLSAVFPLLLLVLIPFLYWKATQHLNDYLR